LAPLGRCCPWAIPGARCRDSPRENSPINAEGFDVDERRFSRGRDAHISSTFRLRKNIANDCLTDRTYKRRQVSPAFPESTREMRRWRKEWTRSCDRTKEHPGTSDRAIVFLCRLLLEAVAAVDRGETRPIRDPASRRAVRPHQGLLKSGADWRAAFAVEGAAHWLGNRDLGKQGTYSSPLPKLSRCETASCPQWLKDGCGR